MMSYECRTIESMNTISVARRDNDDLKCLHCEMPLGHEPVTFIDNCNPHLGGCHLRCVDAYHARKEADRG